MTSAQLLVSRLLLAIGAVSAFGCSSDSTASCTAPEPVEKCLARDQAWVAARGDGGASGQGGQSSQTPDGCPDNADIRNQQDFFQKAGLSGFLLESVRADGDQCCYTTSAPCEGRPFVVDGALRTARWRRDAAWV